MEREEDAMEAVKENASVFEGRHLRVDIAAADRVTLIFRCTNTNTFE